MKKSRTKVNLNDDLNHEISASPTEVQPKPSPDTTSLPCVLKQERLVLHACSYQCRG